jgi:dihydroorotate dehydrogenase
MLFLSPPFGNYINLPKTTSIKGSFTLEPRPGIFGQIIKTLYYSEGHNGWVNKIGLRNKGIDFAINKYKNGWFPFYRNSVISIAILKRDEIDKFLEKLPPEIPLEINVSCPNTEHSLISKNLHKFITPERKWCSIKLSPLATYNDIKEYYDEGFRIFHCSNTIPIEDGGLSGPSLKPLNSKLINTIKLNFPDAIIISGGGIQSMDDIKYYKLCGANHFSISSVCFNPFRFLKLYSLYCYYE